MKPLSVRLGEALVAARDRDTHVIVMTPEAADELIILVEAAEAVVASYEAAERVLAPNYMHSVHLSLLGFSDSQRRLGEAISRLNGILG